MNINTIINGANISSIFVTAAGGRQNCANTDSHCIISDRNINIISSTATCGRQLSYTSNSVLSDRTVLRESYRADSIGQRIVR